MIDLKQPNWGGSISLAGRQLTYRQVGTVGGVFLWILIMLVRTGGGGISSLLSTGQFLIGILLLTCSTRTVRLQSLFSLFFAGGFMMGLLSIIGPLMDLTTGSSGSVTRVVLIEELLIVLPPFWILWRWRNGRAWSLGVSDIFLMFVFCGAGFSMVETAYILKSQALVQLNWLPVVAWDGDRIRGMHLFNGHEIWGGLAGIAVGLSFLLRNKGAWVWSIAAGGIALGIVDHYVLDAAGGDFLGVLTGRGVLALIAFVVGSIAAVVIDAKVIKILTTELKELLLKPLWTKEGLAAALRLRALAFGNYQFERAVGKDKQAVANECLRITDAVLETALQKT